MNNVSSQLKASEGAGVLSPVNTSKKSSSLHDDGQSYRLHQIQGYIQNIFLVEYKHGCMLLDGACKADLSVVSKYFEQRLKRPLSDLKVVMVTHMHPDHAGCAHLLRKLSGCKVICGYFDEHWYKGIKGALSHLTDIALSHWVAGRLGIKRRLIWYPRKLKPDLMLQNKENIPGFEDWHVISTPGHTAMDISIVHNKTKRMYVADLIVKVKGKLCPPFPVYFPHHYKQSLQKLYDYQGYELMMAHVKNRELKAGDIRTLINKAPDRPQHNSQVILDRAKRLARLHK
uniref:MBL fold metallo-hydrolase n=1 Tax=Ningiella ruwaisensis TaxID=2364274 RepID=UPI0010A03618|nr:MBL fold metallo-hydrolase [Ningiella ruwaisensis]